MSSGHDEIQTKIIIQSILCIIQPLTYIINKSLETGVVPSKLKIAKDIPFFKSSNKEELKNYQPFLKFLWEDNLQQNYDIYRQ